MINAGQIKQPCGFHQLLQVMGFHQLLQVMPNSHTASNMSLMIVQICLMVFAGQIKQPYGFHQLLPEMSNLFKFAAIVLSPPLNVSRVGCIPPRWHFACNDNFRLVVLPSTITRIRMVFSLFMVTYNFVL